MEAAPNAIRAPHRRQILSLVRDGELSAGEIATHFEVTRPAVSQHLTVLKEAGLVDERRNGTRRLYRARPSARVALVEAHRCAAGTARCWREGTASLRSGHAACATAFRALRRVRRRALREVAGAG